MHRKPLSYHQHQAVERLGDSVDGYSRRPQRRESLRSALSVTLARGAPTAIEADLYRPMAIRNPATQEPLESGADSESCLSDRPRLLFNGISPRVHACRKSPLERI